VLRATTTRAAPSRTSSSRFPCGTDQQKGYAQGVGLRCLGDRITRMSIFASYQRARSAVARVQQQLPLAPPACQFLETFSFECLAE